MRIRAVQTSVHVFQYRCNIDDLRLEVFFYLIYPFTKHRV